MPSDFIVAATGTLQTKAELDTYKKTGAANTVSRSNKPVLYQPATKGGNKTLSYYAEQVPTLHGLLIKIL